MVFDAPAGVSEADVVAVLQGLLDRHAMLRLRVEDDGAERLVADGARARVGGRTRAWGRWPCSPMRRWCGPVEVGSWRPGVMLSAVWVAEAEQLALIIHHLAVDGVSWRVLLEDLNIAWAQHHSGQPVALPAAGTSFARWSVLLSEYARDAACRGLAETWRQVAAIPPALAAVGPGRTPTRCAELVGVAGCGDDPAAAR